MRTSRRAALSSPRSAAKARHSRLTRLAACFGQSRQAGCLEPSPGQAWLPMRSSKNPQKKFSVRAFPAAAVVLQQLQLGSAGGARRCASSLRSTLSFWLSAWTSPCGCPVRMSCDITRKCDSLDPAATSVSPSGCAPSLLCLLQSSHSAKSVTLDAAPAERMATGHQPKTKKREREKRVWWPTPLAAQPGPQSDLSLSLLSLLRPLPAEHAHRLWSAQGCLRKHLDDARTSGSPRLMIINTSHAPRSAIALPQPTSSPRTLASFSRFLGVAVPPVPHCPPSSRLIAW